MLKLAKSSPKVIGLLIKLIKNNHFDNHRSFAKASPKIVLLVKPMLKHYENKAKTMPKSYQNKANSPAAYGTKPVSYTHLRAHET